MARERVVIEGDEKLQKQLTKIVKGVDDLREVGKSAAKPVADRAYGQVPVDSGALQADIRTFATKTNAGVRVGRKRLPYAGPIIGGHGADGVERPQGGYIAPPRPFLFNAMDERHDAVIATYERFIDDLVAGKRPKAAVRYRIHEDE